MSEKLGESNLLCENPNRVLSNSENSDGSEDRKGKKPFLPSSNSPTPTLTPTSSTPLNWKQGRSSGDGGGNGGCGGSGGGGGYGVESNHDEGHVLAERDRRKKMRNMFSTLHDLLPHLPPKTDKSTIIEAAAVYIKTLEHTLENLQKQKLDMMRGVTAMNCDASMVTPTTLALNSREAYLANHVPSMNSAFAANTSQCPSVPSFRPTSFKTWCSPNFVLNVSGEDAQISICVPKKPGLLNTILCVVEKHKVEVVTFQISSDSYRSMFMIQAHSISRGLATRREIQFGSLRDDVLDLLKDNSRYVLHGAVKTLGVCFLKT